jgi:hypothetical protein
MARFRDQTPDDPAALAAAYRKSRFALICNGVFFFVCCAVAVIVRKMIGMPPALLTVVFAVALVLFGGDIMRFLSLRRRYRRLLAQNS